MFDWLKKIGGSKPPQNNAGLDQKAVAFLAQDFGQLEKLGADLPAEMLRYALDGEEADVLTRLAATQGASLALELIAAPRGFISGSGQARGSRVHRDKFFETLQGGQPEFFVRLGKIYAAALQADSSNQVTARFPQLASLVSAPAFGDPNLAWLEILLIEATRLQQHVWPRQCSGCRALTADLIESMLKAEGRDPAILIRAVFQPQLQRFSGAPLEPVFNDLQGLGESAVRHKATMIEALTQADFKQRIYAMSMMKGCKVPATPFAETLVLLALDSSKQVREYATPLLADAKTAARPLVERKIVEGAPEEKVLAIELLHAWDAEGVKEFLQGRLAEEKNKKVLRAIEEALATAVPQSTAPVASVALDLPPLAALSSHAPLGKETEDAWDECFQKVNAGIAKANAAQAGQRHVRGIKQIGAEVIARSFASMQTGKSNEGILSDLFHISWQKELTAPIREFWQRPELNILHLVRFLNHLGALRADREHDRGVFSYGYWLETLMPAFRRGHPEAGLRELAAGFTAAGFDARRIGNGLLQSYQENPAPLGLPAAQIWPYWGENLELLERAFVPVSSAVGFMQRYDQRHARQNAFHALATFPRPPERLVPLLWKVALGGKSERPSAQRCLEGLPDKFERLVASLGTGDSDSRLAAAEWLGRLGDARAVDPLFAALKREKNEAAKGTMMSALESLGAPVEQFLDRQSLLKEAQKGIGKGVPEDLKWFPFDRLPVVHWSDDNRAVDSDILKWWLIQGFKLKNPEAGPLLRRYCASLNRSEREALGQLVLEAWLAEDIAPIPRAEAEQRAMQQAQQYAQWCQSPHWPSGSPKKTVQEFYNDFLPGLLQQPKGSAVASKGILSVVGACGGAAVAPMVGRYLKQWYGMRAAQCRALLQMLVWIEHKTATQLLLAVGTRFRTKSIQEEANKQAQALAERKGWTVAELADRTIPTAGLDDDGILTLDFGPRQFTAKLTEDLEFALSDPDGKPIKSLPDPRKEDDEAKAGEAKKMFSAAKKELKSVVTMQRDRLYEAMCTQRTWPFEDWNIYLSRHPIGRHHCQRLVWSVIRDEKVVALFRPLPDGSLTDANDDPISVNPDDLVRVAHECQVTPEQSATWRNHLKDYEIEPLFEQFGRPNFDPGEERKQEDELADFRGHVLEAFKLRGRANKLGYTRGQAQDGGWFFDYHKRFPTLGMEAILEFTGNGLPEENRKVALTTFRFERVGQEGEADPGGRMTLGEVPAVLLSECWNDLRQIAAEGPGFDPEWEKKTQP